ncbi:MAG TPA: TonB-dependent receptor [Myxococcales bacterium]
MATHPALAQTEPAAAAPADPAAAPAALPAADTVPAEALPAQPPVAAEPQPAEVVATPTPPPAEIEEIVVTGSRINRADLNTSAPVTVVGREQIATSGRSSVGDILQSLPAQSNAINTQYNNGGDGSTRVDLRGLGAPRTLVLVNGRRFVPGGVGADASVDLNAIPMAAIERIEVLKDGASAIYGSDAIGGVVNIITRRNWTGTEVTAFGGVSQRGDAEFIDLSLTTGHKFDKAYVLFSAGYFKQAPAWSGDRVWSRVDRDYDFTSGEISTIGSSAVPEGMLIDWEGGAGNATWNNLVSTYGEGGTFIRGDDGTWRPFRDAGVRGQGGDYYNYAPANYLVTPQQRFNMMLNASLKLGDSAKAYIETSFTNRQSDQILAAEPLFTISEGLTVSKDNVYNPFGRDFSDVRRRLVEFGGRRYQQDQDTFRIVGGVNGHLPESMGPLRGWYWDLSANYGRNTGTELKDGTLILSRLANALGPSYINAAGAAACGTPNAPIEGCVPLNLFGGPGTITDAMKQYLSYTGTRRGLNEQAILSLNATGDLFTLFANRPVSLAVGYELRNEAGSTIYDPLTSHGDTTGNKSADTNGSFTVNEGFLELSIPIVSGKPGAEDLEINAALRAFNYSTFGSDFTYKLGGRWSVVRDFTLRGTYSTAFRAPSVGELYSGSVDSFLDVTDPCSNYNGAISGSAKTNCAAAGVPTNLEDNRTQQRVLLGGNPNLQPEKAETFTVGAVVEPRFMRGFSLTVDYYHIKITNSISSYGPDVILNGCYSGDNLNQEYCSRIKRDANGLISTIDDPNVNVGGDTTAGLDFGARYDFGTSIGRFSVTADVNWLQMMDKELSDGSIIHAKGNYDTQLVYAPFKGVAGITWGYKGVGAGIHGRYISSFRECVNNACSVPDGEPEPKLYRNVADYGALDIYVSYDLKTDFGKTGFLFGVNNLTDVDPPWIFNGQIVKTDPSSYDFLGRYFYLKLSQNF